MGAGAGARGMKEIPVGDYFVLQLFQSTKWEGSVTWCQIIGGDRYCAGLDRKSVV